MLFALSGSTLPEGSQLVEVDCTYVDRKPALYVIVLKDNDGATSTLGTPVFYSATATAVSFSVPSAANSLIVSTTGDDAPFAATITPTSPAALGARQALAAGSTAQTLYRAGGVGTLTLAATWPGAPTPSVQGWAINVQGASAAVVIGTVFRSPTIRGEQ